MRIQSYDFLIGKNVQIFFLSGLELIFYILSVPSIFLHILCFVFPYSWIKLYQVYVTQFHFPFLVDRQKSWFCFLTIVYTAAINEVLRYFFRNIWSLWGYMSIVLYLKVCRFCESSTIFLWDSQWCSLPTPEWKANWTFVVSAQYLSSVHYMGLYICLCFISQEKTLI